MESLGLFDLDTGEELMTTGSRLANASPTVVGTTVYYATMTASVAAIDIDTEEESWRRDFDGFPRIESSPTVVDGVLFVGTENGTFYALNAGTDGSSEGSRVTDRSLGYHDGIETYDDQGPLSVTPTRPGDDTTAATQEPDSPTPDGATATETTTTDTDAGESGGLPLAALAGGGAVAAVGSYVFGTRILGTNDGDDTGDTNSD